MTPVDNDRPQLYGVPVVPVVSDDEPRGVPPDEVAALLNDIRRVVARYIVLDEQQLDTIALWVMHTFTYREFYTTPYLAIMSPTMRSGKSNLLTVLEAICHDPEIVVHSSTAGLYRTIDELRPTLLFDELDMAQMSKTYRGILHSGYKAGASVTLSVGGKPKRLSTFCPKAYASIGRALTPTLIDRSIQIHMRRKLPTETVAEFSIAGLAAVTEGLRDRLANFRADFIVPDDMPPRPEVLNDREREIWLPLFTIAAQATGWDTRALNAAVRLTADSRQEEPDDSVLLLADIRAAFGGKTSCSATSYSRAFATSKTRSTPDRQRTPPRRWPSRWLRFGSSPSNSASEGRPRRAICGIGSRMPSRATCRNPKQPKHPKPESRSGQKSVKNL